MRHHYFRTLCGEFAEYAIIVSPEFVGVVQFVIPMPTIEPARRPKDFVPHLGSRRRMFELEIAHAHAAGDIVCDAVFKQLQIRNLFGFVKKVFYLALGGEKIPVGAEFPNAFGDDVVVSQANINTFVFLGNELQELHIIEVVICDIARDAARIRRQEILFKEYFKFHAQNVDCAKHRRHIEIEMKIADKKVGHILNLYSRILGVKGTNCELDFPKFQ